LLWVRFFLLAVYATMYVRDHTRPMLHEAMGLDSTEYDFQVFRITTEISKQVFPISLDTDHPAFREKLRRLFEISQRNDAAKAKGGLFSWFTRGVCAAQALWTFGALYLMPVHHHSLPANARMEPSW
jgi:magnesium-protoporphyrin IX monomethyl ester (oxidative) cyclase